MGLFNRINSMTNYSLNATIQTANKIVTNPSAVKKVLQIGSKGLAAYEYGTGKKAYPELNNTMQGAVNLLDLYGFFEDIMYWINPFSKEKVDQKRLCLSLKASIQSHQAASDEAASEALANQVVQGVFSSAKGYYSQADVMQAIKQKLIEKGCSEALSQTVMTSVKINRVARPILQVLATACYTVCDAVGTVLLLKDWGVISADRLAALGQQAARLGGGSSNLFVVLFEFGAKRTITVLATTGSVLTTIDAVYKVFRAQVDLNKKVGEDRQAALKNRQRAMWGLASKGLDLLSSTVPLLVSLNPPVLIAFSILARGVGFIKVVWID